MTFDETTRFFWGGTSHERCMNCRVFHAISRNLSSEFCHLYKNAGDKDRSFRTLSPRFSPHLSLSLSVSAFASEMTCIVSSGALNSTHSLTALHARACVCVCKFGFMSLGVMILLV